MQANTQNPNPFFKLAKLHGSSLAHYTIHRELRGENTRGSRIYHFYVLDSAQDNDKPKPMQYLVLQNSSKQFVGLVKYEDHSISEVCRLAESKLEILVQNKPEKLLLQA
jgi:hypothetical protein